jgi:hypothetical protein
VAAGSNPFWRKRRGGQAWWMPWYLVGQLLVLIVLVLTLHGWLLAVVALGVVAQSVAVLRAFVGGRPTQPQREQNRRRRG